MCAPCLDSSLSRCTSSYSKILYLTRRAQPGNTEIALVFDQLKFVNYLITNYILKYCIYSEEFDNSVTLVDRYLETSIEGITVHVWTVNQCWTFSRNTPKEKRVERKTPID